ncbi:MAG: putative lipoate-protein ligase [Symbiobacteriaceae bacterium]|nr:putative lipoate-protein ligase [Symbiobacteriaceae bacterium]
MDIKPLPYDATALERFDREGPFVWLWEPAAIECVLGAGTPANDIDLALCAASGVPVYRRKGGGGAVVLGPGDLIITAAYDATRKTFASQWINPIAEAIVRAVQRLGIAGAHVRGLGDVAIGERKILGSSLYANRKVALFQGSLLVDPDLSLIPIYLPHPSKEPDYRRGRDHLNFVTSLVEQGYDGDMEWLKRTLAEELTQV